MDKRKKLLISAKYLFASKGFDKTSIRDIASHAGVNSSMISYYFGGKLGMIKAIFEEFFPQKESDLVITNPVKQLKQLIKAIIILRKKDTELVDFLHREIISNENMDIIRPYIEPFWTDVRKILVEGKRRVLNYTSLDAAFKYIQALMSYPYHLQFTNEDEHSIEIDDCFVEELVQLVMKGVT